VQPSLLLLPEHASLLNYPSKSLYLIDFTTTMVNGSNNERNEERLEELHSRSPSQNFFDVATPMMRLVLSANVESARPHFDIEPITTYRTNYSHPMDARHGSNDERNDERLEELHSCSPPHSKLDALVAVVNIDRPFFAAASEGSRAKDGNAANNLRRQRGGFNGFSLYRRHAKQNGLKCTNSRFKQEWNRLPYEDREQYNRLARALKNNR
jgi:hypothetical protein